jgi:hypothetical protein
MPLTKMKGMCITNTPFQSLYVFQSTCPTIHGTKQIHGAILSNTATFFAFVEFMLCYHAWCHYSHQLPKELQEDIALIDFVSRMVVEYFDSILIIQR